MSPGAGSPAGCIQEALGLIPPAERSTAAPCYSTGPVVSEPTDSPIAGSPPARLPAASLSGQEFRSLIKFMATRLRTAWSC